MKRTLKKELKVLEIAERETIGTSFSCPSRIQPTLPLFTGSKVGKLPVCVFWQVSMFLCGNGTLPGIRIGRRPSLFFKAGDGPAWKTLLLLGIVMNRNSSKKMCKPRC